MRHLHREIESTDVVWIYKCFPAWIHGEVVVVDASKSFPAWIHGQVVVVAAPNTLERDVLGRRTEFVPIYLINK